MVGVRESLVLFLVDLLADDVWWACEVLYLRLDVLNVFRTEDVDRARSTHPAYDARV